MHSPVLKYLLIALDGTDRIVNGTRIFSLWVLHHDFALKILVDGDLRDLEGLNIRNKERACLR